MKVLCRSRSMRVDKKQIFEEMEKRRLNISCALMASLLLDEMQDLRVGTRLSQEDGDWELIFGRRVWPLTKLVGVKIKRDLLRLLHGAAGMAAGQARAMHRVMSYRTGSSRCGVSSLVQTLLAMASPNQASLITTEEAHETDSVCDVAPGMHHTPPEHLQDTSRVQEDVEEALKNPIPPSGTSLCGHLGERHQLGLSSSARAEFLSRKKWQRTAMFHLKNQANCRTSCFKEQKETSSSRLRVHVDCFRPKPKLLVLRK
ncbi:hypothetical protein DV515_00004242 [Chloebia gouldiae]|uniref:Uncharacterized protein n=1 Tax=Chloebia gouldiae TaxID=44316 RepID=A0A3L8SS94_CHLGU|nr:hypothetical protein DV515_00004242 [Chloebia gouldiae]